MAELLERLGFVDPYDFVQRWEVCALTATLKFVVWQRIRDPGAFLRSVMCGADVGALKPFVVRCMSGFLGGFRHKLWEAERRMLQTWLDCTAKRSAEGS